MSVSIQLINAKEISSKLKKIDENIKTAIAVSATESGMLLKEEIESSIAGQRAEPRSVKTGNFLNSVELQSTSEGIEIWSDVEYAKFLEYGTIYIEERRHFRNSMDRMIPIIKEKFGKEIKKALSK